MRSRGVEHVRVIAVALSVQYICDCPIASCPHSTDICSITVMKYCEAVRSASATLPVRMFAQVYSGFGPSTGWAEFSSKAAWLHAGQPTSLAFAWYKGTDIVRVAIARRDDGKESYANYCYRPDGSLAEFRSLPIVDTHCDRALLHCDVTLHGSVRVYPSREWLGAKHTLLMTPQLKTFGVDCLLPRTLKSESSSVFFSPVRWREYMNVSELPFSGLL